MRADPGYLLAAPAAASVPAASGFQGTGFTGAPARACCSPETMMRSPLATVEQQGHVAAAAYLMKHAGVSALMVLDARTGQPAGIIMEADIAHAVADGKDVNSIRVYELMTACST